MSGLQRGVGGGAQGFRCPSRSAIDLSGCPPRTRRVAKAWRSQWGPRGIPPMPSRSTRTASIICVRLPGSGVDPGRARQRGTLSGSRSLAIRGAGSRPPPPRPPPSGCAAPLFAALCGAKRTLRSRQSPCRRLQRGHLATPHPVADEQEHDGPVTGRHPISRHRPEQAADILLARPLRDVHMLGAQTRHRLFGSNRRSTPGSPRTPETTASWPACCAAPGRGRRQ